MHGRRRGRCAEIVDGGPRQTVRRRLDDVVGDAAAAVTCGWAPRELHLSGGPAGVGPQGAGHAGGDGVRRDRRRRGGGRGRRRGGARRRRRDLGRGGRGRGGRGRGGRGRGG